MNRITLLFNIFILFTIAFARNPKDRYGILYVNEIEANIDTFTVQIEDCFVEDNILRLDIIEEWTGNGVFGEDIYFDDGNVELFDDFVVNPPTNFPGELYANGGIYADKGKFADPVEDFYSFVVTDDIGDTNFGGLLYVDNGVFSDIDAFTVAAGSGDTTVRNARFNANGGINVNEGEFTSDVHGNVFVNSNVHVLETVVLGTSVAEERYITRVTTPSQVGGDTLFSAQDGTASGGDLYLVPGVETSCTTGKCNDGVIFLGDINNANIRVTRADVSGPGSLTSYHGQDSPNGDGGDMVFQAGDSLSDGNGGDLILIPGLSNVGTHGAVYLGTNELGLSSFDLTVQRPLLSSGNGGDTFFVGQNTQNGKAGNLNILAGQGSTGGTLYLVPGDANQDSGRLEEQGDIVLGNPNSAALIITRSESNTNGGDTFFEGQESDSNDGGELFLKAGSSAGNGNGGNIHLLPGSFPASPGNLGVPAGRIFVGDQVDDLLITRETRDGGGLDTYIIGQNGAASQGGDLFLNAGNGATTGGDVFVLGGFHDTTDPLAFAVGGGVIVESGSGQIDGANINISAGDDPTLTNSGDVNVITGGITAGSIYLNGGSGLTLGDVTVGDFSDTFVLDSTPLVVDGSFIELQEGSERLIIRADPMNILEYRGKTLLRSVSDYPVPAVRTDVIEANSDFFLTETTYRVALLQNSLEILVNALSQCQHGLFETLDEFGVPDSCVAFTD